VRISCEAAALDFQDFADRLPVCLPYVASTWEVVSMASHRL
jgi:hypothetical protein